MPGSTEARAMALAAMTESPIAMTCRPGTLRWAGDCAGLAAGSATAGRDVCDRVAALTRSPLMICFSMPDGAPGGLRAPHPVTASTAAAHSACRARPGERPAAWAELPAARRMSFAACLISSADPVTRLVANSLIPPLTAVLRQLNAQPHAVAMNRGKGMINPLCK